MCVELKQLVPSVYCNIYVGLMPLAKYGFACLGLNCNIPCWWRTRAEDTYTHSYI